MAILSKDFPPLPAQPPRLPAGRAQRIAMMEQEYADHTLRLSEIWKAAEEKQAASHGAICRDGLDEFFDEAGLPRRQEHWRRPVTPVEAPGKALDGNYEYYTDEGLAHLRQQRLDAWRTQLERIRKVIISYGPDGHRGDYLTRRTMEDALRRFGMDLPRTITQASISVSVSFEVPEAAAELDAQLRERAREAIKAAFPEIKSKTNISTRASHAQVREA